MQPLIRIGHFAVDRIDVQYVDSSAVPYLPFDATVPHYYSYLCTEFFISQPSPPSVWPIAVASGSSLLFQIGATSSFFADLQYFQQSSVWLNVLFNSTGALDRSIPLAFTQVDLAATPLRA